MGVPDPDQDPQFYEGVPLRRLVAFLIDMIVIAGLWFAAVFVGFLLTVLSLGAGLGLAMLLLTLTGFVYRVLMLRYRSATVGMLVTGIEVRDQNGAQADQTFALLHTAGFYATMLFPPLLLIGWVLLAGDPHRRAMHDIFLRAVVINRPVTHRP